MRLLKLLITLCVLTSCSDKKDLELKIISDEMICLKNINIDSVSNWPSYRNEIYKQSKNIVKYSLKNNSNKKYFLVFNDSYIEAENVNKDYLFYGYNRAKICVNMYDKDSLADSESLRIMGHFNSDNPQSVLFESTFIADTIRANRDKELNEKKDRKLNSYIIYPGEKKYFTTIIHLPVINYYYQSSLTTSFLIKENKNYDINISIKNKAKDTKENLSGDQKREIEENGYTIFDGELQSNKIPVKLIPFKD